MRVLGIDPGSRHCGFGAVEAARGGTLRHLAHGVIALDGPLEERLLALHRALGEALAAQRPQVVAVEEVHAGQNARSALVLGQARGVALLAAAQSGARVRGFAPSVIKQAVTGSGRADKAQVARMVCGLLGLPGAGLRSDATDALAAAVCALLREPPAALAPPSGPAVARLERVPGARPPTPANLELQRLLAGARRRRVR